MKRIYALIQSDGFRSLSGDSMWTLISQMVILVVNLGVVYVLANLFSPNDYGQLKLITTWLALAVGLGYTGYTYTLPQKIANNKNYNLKEIYSKTIWRSAFTFLILLVISLYYLFNENLNLSFGFLFASILGPILCASALVNAYYMGRKDFKMFALAQNSVDLIQFIAIFILAYFSNNFIFIISGYFIVTITANLAIVFKTLIDDQKYKNSNLYKHEVTDELDTKETKLQSKLNLAGILLGFTNQVDKLLIFHFIGAAPLAIYSLITAMSDQARTPVKAISSAMFPRMSIASFSKNKMYLSLLVLTLFSSLMYIVLYLLYPFIFENFFPKYVDYIHFANLASIGIIFAPINFLYLYAQAKGDLHTLNRYTNLNSVMQVFLFGFSTLLGSLLLFFYSRIAISIISFVYVLYRVRKL
jgi:O-antigen/teichoic acid export membrane protein